MAEWSRDSSREQLIHRRYNKASASVEMLKRMIGEHEVTKKRKERTDSAERGRGGERGGSPGARRGRHTELAVSLDHIRLGRSPGRRSRG